MKTTNIVVSVAAIALLAACSFAQDAQGGNQGRPRGNGGPGGPGGMGGMQINAVSVMTPPSINVLSFMANQLALTSDQQTSLKTIITTGNTTLKPLLEKSTKAVQALQTALYAATYDSAKVKALVVAAQKTELDVMNAEVDIWAKVRAELNSDQITTLNKLTTTRQNRGGMGQRNGMQNQDGTSDQQPPQGPPPGDGNGEGPQGPPPEGE